MKACLILFRQKMIVVGAVLLGLSAMSRIHAYLYNFVVVVLFFVLWELSCVSLVNNCGFCCEIAIVDVGW